MKADKLLDGKELKSTLDDVSNDPTSDPMEVTTTDDKKLDASYKCNFRKKLIVGGRSATRGNKEEVKKIKEDYMAKKREKKAEEKKERDEQRAAALEKKKTEMGEKKAELAKKRAEKRKCQR